MKFSIIIPVYKVEEYLKECVDSVLIQNYNDFEVILIDDGSPDKCPEICDEYAKNDARVKVIHKKNGGLSSARNAGMDAATGDYIVFLDSDDWIDQGCLSGFANVLNKNSVELLMTTKTSWYEDGAYLETDDFEDYLKQGFDKKRAVDWMLNYGKSVGAPNKILKKSFIDENNLRFLEGILHEDHDWTYKLCIKANSFAGYTKPWYNYRIIREGSITHKRTWKNTVSVIQTAAIYAELYKKDKNYFTEAVYHHAMGALYVSINYVSQMDEKSVQIIIDELKKRRHVFSYAQKPSQFLFMIVLRLLGPTIAINLLRRM